jgi:hypothetical protein
MNSRKFLCLVATLATLSFAVGWVRYDRQSSLSRHVSPTTLLSAPQAGVSVPLNAWLDTSDLAVGDRVDLLVSAGGSPVPLVFDALVSHKDGRQCLCVMPLADGRLLARAAATNQKITFRTSVVPGEWSEASGLRKLASDQKSDGSGDNESSP